MSRLALTNDELLTTTRSVRKRLDLERPVEREVVDACIELALQAPSGGNRQLWHWVVVTEPATRAAIADQYGDVFDRYVAGVEASTPAAERIRQSAVFLREHLHEVPVLVLPCHLGRPEATPGSQAGYWAGIFPAVWSFQLALRSRGLGSVITTLHLFRERAVADIVGIPFDECAQACLLPVAYTVGTSFKPAARQPAASVVHWERW